MMSRSDVETTTADRIPALLKDWAAAGAWHEVNGHLVFVRHHRPTHPDHHTDSDREPLVLIHGFPSSSADFSEILPLLLEQHEVILLDLPGFGLSSKPAHGDYSLISQCACLISLLNSLSVQRCRVICHDMGNSVLCEWLHQLRVGADVPEISRIDMLNGGLYMALHRPLLTQRLLRTPVIGALVARLSSWRVFMLQYPKVYAHPERFDHAHYQQQWALMCHAGGRRVWAGTAIYMRERLHYAERWLGALHDSRIPLKVIWGTSDPIAVAEIARKLHSHRPDARIHWLEDCGHYPQLEEPQQVAQLILSEWPD